MGNRGNWTREHVKEDVRSQEGTQNRWRRLERKDSKRDTEAGGRARAAQVGHED